jgi:hypothetical protein
MVSVVPAPDKQPILKGFGTNQPCNWSRCWEEIVGRSVLGAIHDASVGRV